MREAEAKKSGRASASSNLVSPVIKDMPLKGTKNEQNKGEPNLILGKSTDQAKSKGKSLQNSDHKSKAKKGAAGKPVAPQEPIRSFFTMQIREGGAVVLLVPRPLPRESPSLCQIVMTISMTRLLLTRLTPRCLTTDMPVRPLRARVRALLSLIWILLARLPPKIFLSPLTLLWITTLILL